MADSPSRLPAAVPSRRAATFALAATVLAVATTLVVGGRFLATSLAGPTKAEAAETARLRVAVSVAPYAWLVDRVSDGTVDTIVALPAGADCGTYQPSDRAMSRLAGAELYVRCGLGAEDGPWFHAVREAADFAVLELRAPGDWNAAACCPNPGCDHGPHDVTVASIVAADDAHRWTSPAVLRTDLARITEALCYLDPEHAVTYLRNAAVVDAELAAVQDEIRATLRGFAGAPFLVEHAAWGAFASEFGLVQHAIEVNGHDPSDHALTTLTQLVHEQGLHAIAVQPSRGGRAAKALARAADLRVVSLDPQFEDPIASLPAIARQIAAMLSPADGAAPAPAAADDAVAAATPATPAS